MALPSSGPIWLSQIQAEFGGPNYYISSYYRGGGYTTTNNLGVPASGVIYFSNFWGAVKATSGSAGFGVGTSYMTIPPYQWMTIYVYAGGGGGGGGNLDIYGGNAGANGGDSHCYGYGADVWAGGGAGGAGCNYYYGVNYPGGEPRAGDGWGNNGAAQPGGRGGVYGYSEGQTGGYGGYSVITYYPGQLSVGGTLTAVAGGGGGGGWGGTYGANGADGVIYVYWG